MASTALHCGGDSWELASAAAAATTASKIHGYNQTNSHAAATARLV